MYRIIKETVKNREDVLLQIDLGRILGPNESATLLAETFFPDDRFDADDPYHAEAVIFRDLGLFLAMANKCLEFGYFRWAWKVAAIKVITKLGKDDYARPKS
ncbi:hypothetical protein EVAR_63146_1 [Eumeta japonica]|uniref:Uncharacterized protein n=1 Tax=Eumeta variegata TaxID=151549 RepID=A0A4C2AAY5_EUMVA|nr:hypothetical protein EVAR_63146_1 [Eumeta japonica]